MIVLAVLSVALLAAVFGLILYGGRAALAALVKLDGHLAALELLRLPPQNVQVVTATAAVAAIKSVEERLDKVEALVRYELLAQLADDAIHYAEQQEKQMVKKRDAAPWTWRDRFDAALHYAQAQAKVVGVVLDSSALQRAIESRLGRMNAEKEVAA